MTLSPGTKLGTYEIAGPLGKGGMGEVYRAHDFKLKREVALKILPAEFSSDTERVSRFQREAEMLASLNHPHIAAIYDLGESGPSRFIVMELVEGDTLAERIRGGPIPIEDALQISKQIAEALEAAHDRGIIHRDLKPANIKVSPDGAVKVLDFGLAKMRQDDTSSGLSNSPTMMSVSTPGTILGTAAYMSPEQAKGRELDRTADLWAFGCVLYEMLTGRVIFEGESVGEILGGIFRAEPDWQLLPPETPQAIRRLLRRCLQKDRRWRLPTAADARIEITEAQTNPGAELPVFRPVPHSRRERWLWVGAMFVAFAAIVGLAIPFFRAPIESPEMRLDLVTPAKGDDPVSFAISPDGQRLVFVASGEGASRLWLRPLNGLTSQPLAGTEGASYPFWSPDSKSIGFFADGKLKRIDIGGGLPQAIADAPSGRGGTWNAAGTILFAPNTSNPILSVSASGGQTVSVTKIELPRQSGHRFPQFLPDGRSFLFYVTGAPDGQGVYLGTLDSREIRRLVSSDTAAAYLPPGFLLLGRQGTVVALKFDLSRKQVSGDAVTVADQVSIDSASFAGAFSVSASGMVAYRLGGGGQRQLTWFDRSGKVLGTLGPQDENGLTAPTLSGDGRRASAFRTMNGNVDVWLFDESRLTRLTFDPSNDRYPIWSPDGKQILFDSNRKGPRNLYLKPSNNSGSEQLLFESSQDKAAANWSRDGRFIAVTVIDPKTGRDIVILPTDGDRKPITFLQTTFDERGAQFSPDGRWILYQSNESGHDDIYIRPFPGPGGQWQISTAGGIQPRWASTGKEVYYIAPDGKLMSVPISVKDASIEPGGPVPLFQTRIWGGGSNNSTSQQYDVAPDGRFLINVTTESAATFPITLVLNWKPKP